MTTSRPSPPPAKPRPELVTPSDRRPPQRRGPVRRARSPFLWLRRFLLLLGIAGLGGLGTLLYFSFGGDPQTAEEATEPIAEDDGTVLAGETIDFVQTSGGEPVFRVRADSSTQDQEGVLRLQGVTLDVYRENEDNLQVVSQRARVDQNTNDVRLEGDVVLSGWGDLEVESRALDVLGKGQRLVSKGAVRFRQKAAVDRGQTLVGRASQMRVDKDNDTIFLGGGVHLRTEAARTEPDAAPPMELDCVRLVYRRGEGLIRAVEKVYLRRGDQEIRSHYLSLFLNEDRSVKTVRARWNVEGSLRSLDDAGGETEASFRGQFLEVDPSEQDAAYRNLVLEGGNGETASFRTVSPDGLERTLVARRLETASYDGQLSQIRAFGEPMTLTEALAMPDGPWPLRTVCADRLAAGFQADGALDQMFLEGQVSLNDGETHLAGGERARINGVTGRVEIEGPEVELYAERGEIAAPTIRYSRNTGLIQAEGGVQTVLADPGGVLDGTPLSEGEGPVRVQSREAHWTEIPPGFVFKGAVRAWRGQNLLIAEQLRGDQATQEMAASGGVKSSWIPIDAEGRQQSTPVEVSAETLSFRATENAVVYTGDVTVVQDRRTIRCGELAIEMVEGGSAAERMLCRGDVRLVDPVGGKRVTGDRAEYHVTRQMVEVFGDRVRLVDGQNNRAEGGYLTYDLATGQARVSHRPPSTAGSAP